VPNQRAENQNLIAFALDNQLLTLTDQQRKLLGRDRSTFIRQAIIEKLQRMGIKVDESLAFSPDRAASSINSEKTDSAAIDACKKASHMGRKRRKPPGV